MLSIKLMRMGKKKQPFYRIVVVEKRSPVRTATVDEIGYYNPLPEDIQLKIDLEKLEYWQKRGAQPTKTVKSLIKRVKKQAQKNN